MIDVACQHRDAGLRAWVSMIGELTKIRITVMVTLSVATGFLVFSEHLSVEILLPLAGTFLLACGSAVLNQVQEARIDALMPRTKGRPIPSERITRQWAIAVAIALLGAGFTLLASIERHTLTVLALGLLAVLWYNGVYVLLKRITPFAVVPGSLVGAIPPVIGWVAAGGVVSDPTILMLAVFFFLWQIPHFWLLLIWHGSEYEKAGLPALTAVFSPVQLARITTVWILAVATAGVLLGAEPPSHLPWNALIVVSSVWLSLSALSFIRVQRIEDLVFRTFMQINIFVLLIMVFLVGNAFY